VDGLKVPPDNVEGLEQAINQVLDNPAWAAQLAAKGREKTINQYTWEVVVDTTLTLYHKMSADHKSKAPLAAAR
ncbi:MAG TPA: glycosyltransferase family 4 protein, partial [Firmicutes bacterium]|nr:glycosyltransferase family 4 protein [Bacillota bacterium]